MTRCIVKFEATKIKRRFYEQLEAGGGKKANVKLQETEWLGLLNNSSKILYPAKLSIKVESRIKTLSE